MAQYYVSSKRLKMSQSALINSQVIVKRLGMREGDHLSLFMSPSVTKCICLLLNTLT